MRFLIGTLAAATMLASGCGSGTQSVATGGTTASATRSQVPFPSPSPTQPPVPCAAGTNPCLAVVSLGGRFPFLVRDISDISHPKTVGQTFAFRAQFVSATEVAYIEAFELFRAPIDGAHQRTMFGTPQVLAFAWSPDGGSVAYISYNNQYNTEVHLLRNGSDKLLATAKGLPDIALSVPCQTRTCIDRNDFQIAYSPDGGLIMWNDSSGSKFRIWTADGVDVTPALGSTFMPVWSGSSLFFQDSKGIEVFRSGAVSLFLPGVKWIRPKASPKGGQIVYESRDTSGLAHAYIVDTATAAARELSAGRAEPAFLTSRFIWYQGERLCTASERCDPATPVTATGKTYIYDLGDSTETQSIITSVIDVWPHAA